MPARTNPFQRAVAMLLSQVGNGATVEESAMLKPLYDGDPQEVDVVIRRAFAEFELILSVEATHRNRPATVEWVREMIGKHQCLQTNKLVLYSASGFTPGAVKRAQRDGVETIAAKDLKGSERPIDTDTLWLKSITFRPQRVQLDFALPGTPRIHAPPKMAVHFAGDKLPPCALNRAIEAALSGKINGIDAVLRDRSERGESAGQVVFDPFQVVVDGVPVKAYAHVGFEPDKRSLVEIVRAIVDAEVTIDVSQVDVRQVQVGEYRMAFGAATHGGGAEMVCIVLDEGGQPKWSMSEIKKGARQNRATDRKRAGGRKPAASGKRAARKKR